MTIGERIKARRIELDMTQQDLAEKVGYKGKTAISKIESGERDLRQSKIKPVAEALNTTVEYIMGWDDTDPLSDLEQKILELYRKLPDNKKIALYEFVKTLVGS